MYGIIGLAVAIGVPMVWIMKKNNAKDYTAEIKRMDKKAIHVGGSLQVFSKAW